MQSTVCIIHSELPTTVSLCQPFILHMKFIVNRCNAVMISVESTTQKEEEGQATELKPGNLYTLYCGAAATSKAMGGNIDLWLAMIAHCKAPQ